MHLKTFEHPRIPFVSENPPGDQSPSPSPSPSPVGQSPSPSPRVKKSQSESRTQPGIMTFQQ